MEREQKRLVLPTVSEERATQTWYRPSPVRKERGREQCCERLSPFVAHGVDRVRRACALCTALSDPARVRLYCALQAVALHVRVCACVRVCTHYTTDRCHKLSKCERFFFPFFFSQSRLFLRAPIASLVIRCESLPSCAQRAETVEITESTWVARLLRPRHTAVI